MNKWIHFIGLAGVTMASLAKAFKDEGATITGSDKGFYPPVTDYLQKNGIAILPGFDKERLSKESRHPDLVVIQGSKGDLNEEYLEVKNLGLNISSFAPLLKEKCVVTNSIVVAGSFGKTTTTALIVNILKKSGIDISYMYGAYDNELNDNLRFKTKATEYSIIEGDEYLNSFIDRTSKFFFYAPKFLVITGIKWDHQDLFPTFEAYKENFAKLIREVPEDGMIIANADDNNLKELLKEAKAKIIYCSMELQPNNKEADWFLIKDAKPDKVLMRKEKDKESMQLIPFQRQFLGSYNDQNILLAAALCFELGIPKDKIMEGIKDFKGLKRRLEIRYQSNNNYIIDDFGSTPAKAKVALQALREEYPQHKIIVVIDPAAGSRIKNALAQFNDVFSKEKVYIPRFSHLPKSNIERYSEEDFASMIAQQEISSEVVKDDTLLVSKLAEELKSEQIIIVFLGSHSFRGMIKRLIALLT